MTLLIALIVLLVAAVLLFTFCLCRIAALSDPDLPHADPELSPSPGSAFDDVEFVYPPWVPYERKRRLP